MYPPAPFVLRTPEAPCQLGGYSVSPASGYMLQHTLYTTMRHAFRSPPSSGQSVSKTMTIQLLLGMYVYTKNISPIS